MAFYNAARRNPGRYGSYSDLDRLYLRIVELSKIIEETYHEIGLLAGKHAVKVARLAVSQIKPVSAEKERPFTGPHFEFIDKYTLAFSLFNSANDYDRGRIDTLSFERISDYG